MDRPLTCWRCDATLPDDLPRVFPRLEQCRQCGSDLHVCRMCRFYAPRYLGSCSHDRAEPARDTQVANFCAHFRPQPDAFQPPDSPVDRARGTLDTLFANTSPPATKDDDDAAQEPAAILAEDLFRKPDADS